MLAEAEKQQRILITDDKDFGELIFRLGKPNTGVILFRTLTINPQKRLEILKRLLKFYDPKRKFIVLREDFIRVRKL
ncbi:MAG: DUF5615 family PIN-like protein [Candidatus Methanofastidiosia archaeon]